MREPEVEMVRVNSEDEARVNEDIAIAPRVLPRDRFRWKSVRYAPHQGSRERRRRLAQVALGRVGGALVSPEAREVGTALRAAYEERLAFASYVQIADEYLVDAIRDGDTDAIARRERLYVALHDLYTWVSAGRPVDTTSGSAFAQGAGLHDPAAE